MKVELSERARRTVERLVEGGEFASADAAVEAGLSLLLGPERDLTREELEALVAPAYADIEAGRVYSGEQVVAEARRILETKASNRAR